MKARNREQPVYTVWDARNERLRMEAQADARHAKREAKLEAERRMIAEFDAIAAQHGAIGKLIRKGKPVYYIAFLNAPTVEAADPRELVPYLEQPEEHRDVYAEMKADGALNDGA